MNNRNHPLPTLQQFRESIEDFLLTIVDIYDQNMSETYEGHQVYIDPIRRIQENMPPWYALQPIGSYDEIQNKEGKVIDQRNGGGVIISNPKYGYEIFRIDYFSPPIESEINYHLQTYPSIIKHFPIASKTHLAPGFSVRKSNEVHPADLVIFKDPVEIQSNLHSFSDPEEAGDLSTPKAMFDNNIACLLYSLHKVDISVIHETGHMSAFNSFKPTKNSDFWLAQQNQLILKN